MSYLVNGSLAWGHRSERGCRELKVRWLGGVIPRIGDPELHYTAKGRTHLRLMLISWVLFVVLGAFLALALPSVM